MSRYHFLSFGALAPAMPFAITTGGQPFDLTGKTVLCRCRPWNSLTRNIDDLAAVVSAPATGGAGFYAFQDGDIPAAGHYLVQWVIPELELILPEAGTDHLIVSAGV